MKRKGELSEDEPANKKQECEGPVFWLPPEIWKTVFAFLDPVKDRRSASLVCRTWNEWAWQVLDPSADDNRAILWCGLENRVEMVKRLLKDFRVDPCVENNAVFKQASAHNNVDMMNTLLDDPFKRFNPITNGALSVIGACGMMKIIKLFLSSGHTGTPDNYEKAIDWINCMGHPKVAGLIRANSGICKEPIAIE